MTFHFIRPYWLLALIPIIFIVVKLVRRSDPNRIWHGIIAGHLLEHMIVKSSDHKGIQPHVLLGISMVLMALALAGPTWQKAPAPFADETAALVIAVEVTPTMLAQDIQPSRLERTAHKIRDLLKQRKGSATALVAYAGSAHLVMPLTEDGDLIADFASYLHPSIMPDRGDNAKIAVELAQAQLVSAGRAGSVLLVTDSVPLEMFAQMEALQTPGAPRVHIYAMAAGSDAIMPLDSPPAPPLNRDNLERAANAGRGSLVLVTPNSGDVERLTRIVETQFTPAIDPEGGEKWQNFGYWLIPLISLFAFLWFRPGWTIQWMPVVLVFIMILGSPVIFWAGDQDHPPKKLEKFWFQLPDQKARRLYEAGLFKEAASLFTSPSRQGAAWYHAGEFKKAAAAFGRTDTPEGAFNRGNAFVLLGDYEAAIKSYEMALRERSDWTAALENLELARLRQERMTAPGMMPDQPGGVGRDSEPDEIVFDDRARDQEPVNVKTDEKAKEGLSEEAMRAMWLRRVETNPGDFLRRKFAYQYQKMQAVK